VASFIYSRSGTALSKTVKETLDTLESVVRNEGGRKLTSIEFGQILTETLLKDVDALSDSDISYIAQNMRTVPIWDNPSDVVTILRETGGVILSPQEFNLQAKAFRDQSTDDSRQWRAASRSYIQQEVEKRLREYSAILPAWINTLNEGLTPTQAILVAYSVVSDDPMAGSTVDLVNAMTQVHNFCVGNYQTRPSYNELKAKSEVALQKQTAYGTTGYLFSSPLNFFFDENTLIRLLKQMEERI
jgi:hypothetical protein